MYILPKCIAGIEQKRQNKDAKKSTRGHKTLTKMKENDLLSYMPVF